jgi:hypothetical protein
MSLKSILLAAFAVAFSALHAAPLAETTRVYGAPDAASPVIASLPAGAEPALAPGTSAPAGWTAVTLAGPHDVYAANSSVTKSLEVRVGAAYLTDAKADAPVLALAEKGDVTEITDYRGKFTKFRLTKSVVGYIPTPVAAAPLATVSASTPAATSPQGSAAPAQQIGFGRPAPAGDGTASALPRLFQGTLASTQSPLRPRRPYDYQLTDSAGARYAYVDVSKLLATEQINKYTGRTVVIYGTAKAVPGTKDMVVIAESLQLR